MTERKYTPEVIEELKKKDPNDLTPEERRIANLNPVKKGEVRNPQGRTKGSHNWSTYFKKLMEDEDFLGSILSQTPKQWEGIVEKYPASVIAAGLITSATQNVAKAIADGKPIDKSTLEMIDRIQRIGYGETKNVNLEAEEGGFFDHTKITFEVVPDRKRPEEE